MRRKDREMSSEFGLKVIDKSKYGILSTVDEELPYGIPLSLVRDGSTLYFHSAKQGKKVNIFERNPNVSIVFVGEVNVPEIYTKDELDEMAKDASKTASLISKVFTTEFESAIVTGAVEQVEGEEERIKAMKLICQKYTPSKMQYFDMAIKSGLNSANVYKIDIEEISAKRK